MDIALLFKLSFSFRATKSLLVVIGGIVLVECKTITYTVITLINIYIIIHIN